MNPDCRKFNRNLYHFQAGELPDAECEAFARHAEACPPCGQRLEVEDSFLRGLKGRLARTPAPPGLRTRVVASLRDEPAPSKVLGWLRAPWLVPTAGALLLALVLIPALPAWNPGARVHISQDVTVVDFACDLAGLTVDMQRGCNDPHHLNVLKVSPTSYWNVSLDDHASRALVTDRDMRGHRLHVEGDLYTGIRTVKVASFTDKGMDRLSASGAWPTAVTLASAGDL